jgi:hypothetical protein
MQPEKLADCISQIKSPTSKRNGANKSTMALSTGFTVGLNVNNCFFSIRPEI